ncbi:hypothetical protein ABTM69_20860, partial [Acinetobacter baumannii]
MPGVPSPPVSSDPNELLASLFSSLFGSAFFLYGKKQRRLPQMVGGVLLIGLSMFVSNPWANLALIPLVSLAVFAAVRAGI